MEEPSPDIENEELEEINEPKRRRAIAAEEDSGEPTADPRAIAQVFKKKSRDFKACLELDLRKKAGSSKRLIVQVTIGPSGHVMEVWTVSRKHRNSKLANCIERKIENWRFPSFSGGAAVIEQPIDLTVLTVFVNSAKIRKFLRSARGLDGNLGAGLLRSSPLVKS